MIDQMTQKPFEVRFSEGTAGFVRLPVAQLNEVCRVLDEKGFRYWVSESQYSMNGGPEWTSIQFSHSVDPRAVQSALDRAN